MASVIKSTQIDNNSVVYEHIIPRSVRQSWVRRSSLVGSFDQDVLSINVPSSRDSTLDNTDFLSHDACIENESNQNKSIESEHITEEEEIAVFNAWGVKLRHVRRRTNSEISNEAKHLSNDQPKKIEDSALRSFNSFNQTSILNMTEHHTELAENNSRKQNNGPNNLPRVVESTMKIKRERPKSMPVISAEKVNDSKGVIESNPRKQAAPKAYKSPHAKVPWKRPAIVRKSSEKSFDEDKKTDVVVFNKLNKNDLDLVKNNKDIDNKTSKHEVLKDMFLKEKELEVKISASDNLKSKTKQNKVDQTHSDVNTENNEELLSVFQRRKSFEVSSLQENDVNLKNTKQFRQANGHVMIDAGKLDTTNETVEDKSHLKYQSRKNDKTLSFDISDQGNITLKDNEDKQFEEASRISHTSSENNLNPNKQFKNNSSLPVENSDTKDSKQSAEISKEKLQDKNERDVVEKKHENLQEEQIMKNDGKTLNMQAASNSKAAKIFEAVESHSDLAMSSGTIPVTTVRGHKRRIGSLIIQSGDMRERQHNLKPKTDFVKNSNDDGASIESSGLMKQIAESHLMKSDIDQQYEIPVTNLDDIFVNKEQENPRIPVTNLDEIPMSTESKREKPHLNLTNISINKSKKEKKVDIKQHFCPIKKVDYNEARRFITPKVYFEKPVGLKSVLSPKQKKQDKKKVNVSFSVDNLEDVHMYPSEAAAIELYDEEKTNNGEVTNIDDVMKFNSVSENLACYTPAAFADLTNSLEREREKFALSSNNKSVVEDDTSDKQSTYDSRGDLFTESTESTASAILF